MTRHTLVTAMLLALLNQQAWAESGRSDYDIDDNGLIEINDLADLNEIRNNLNGSSLYGESTGCPVTGCNGFELTTDLDFDTNGNGNIDAGDAYWNNGEGWQPIGSGEQYFNAVFNGNSYEITNLHINRPAEDQIGLFGHTNNADIKNIGISGSAVLISGRDQVGILIGLAQGTTVTASYTNGRVISHSTKYNTRIGGLIGAAGTTDITACYSTGAIISSVDGRGFSNAVGGLIGSLSQSTVQASFSTVAIKSLVNDTTSGGGYIGGLIGSTYDSEIAASYATGAIMALHLIGDSQPPGGLQSVGGLQGDQNNSIITDSFWATDSSGQSSSGGPESGLTLAELQCPTAADDEQCSSVTIYSNWNTYQDTEGLAYWHFGSDQQLPVLRLNGQVYRDSDNDTIVDFRDASPFDYDNDGLTDDQDPDRDNDGIANESDALPYNSNESADDDLDGIGNNEDLDRDGDGLIEIRSLADLDKIRTNLYLYPIESGCPDTGCAGYELVTDLNFDTNNDGIMNELDQYWNSGLGWEPIGSESSGYAYTGVFEGNFHVIRNLYINRPDQDFVGFFGGLSGATVRSLGLIGSLTQVTGRHSVGGLSGAANANSTIKNSYVQGSISGQQYVGGLIGTVASSAITAVYTTGSVNGTSLTGGLIGAGFATIINNSYSNAQVTGVEAAGGLIGGFSGSGPRAELHNSYATGLVSGTNGTGGLIGLAQTSVISNSYWATDSTMQGTAIGENTSSLDGVAGVTQTELKCPTSANNTSCSEQTLFVNWQNLTDDNGQLYWDFGTSRQLPALKFNGLVLRDQDGDGIFDETDPDIDGDGVNNEDDSFPYDPDAWLPEHAVDIDGDGLIEINSVTALNQLRDNLNGIILKAQGPGCPATGCVGFELTSDIDFDTNQNGVIDAGDEFWNDGLGWEPVGSQEQTFSAIFEGNGYQIRNLYINRPEREFVGLFGWIQHGAVNNLHLNGPMTSVTGQMGIGVLAGVIDQTTVSGCSAEATVTGTSHVGVLIGAAIESSLISACHSAGSVSGELYVGGLVGFQAYNAITEASYSNANASGTNAIGGLLGVISEATLYNSYATGVVSGDAYTGGLIGENDNGTISNSHWATDATGQLNSAGESISSGYFGVTLAELKCPVGADNLTCTTQPLFTGWATSVDGEGNPYWNFGTSNDLPTLNILQTSEPDSDGDGIPDSEDTYPHDYDNDGIEDAIDAYPRDFDNDGVDDEFDAFPQDPTETADSDNDGVGNNSDIDADGNGLIEIATLAALDNMRNDLNGTSLNGVTAGCPLNGCNGYELTADLDFDSNQDGVIDASDDFYNNGYGWLPVGISATAPFAAVFEGNGHTISNLYISRATTSYIGLFGYAEGATFRNIGLNGELMHVSGKAYVGGLVGRIYNGNTIINSYVSGHISGNGDYVGGLSGHAYSNNLIRTSFVTGSVSGAAHTGGLIGRVYSSTTIDASFSTASVTGTDYVGGLAGSLYNSSAISHSYASGNVSASGANRGGLIGKVSAANVANSYWATDSSGQTGSSAADSANSYSGALLTQLQCPVSADSTSCAANTLYTGWSSVTDAEGNAYWDFGDSYQLPGLLLNGTVFRDSDGDGIEDNIDNTPFDHDGDGINDAADAFPTDASESLDSDGDGVGDNTDAFPYDATESRDSDNDGVGDNADAFPHDPTETLDTDGDGVGDNADAFPQDATGSSAADAVDADGNGLIEIATLAALDNMRNDLNGTSLNGVTAGCPLNSGCNGYELTADLDFDSNQDGIIDASDDFYNNGYGWLPVGISATAPFAAVFEGNGHTISNLYISRATTSYIGLFGYAEGATFRNIGLNGELMHVSGKAYVGGLVGRIYNGNTIINSYVSGHISGNGDYVGSLSGHAYSNNLIRASFVTGSVSGAAHTGGLIGRVYSSTTIDASFSTASVTGTDYVGGLAGSLYNSSAISHSYASGNVSASGANRGGLIGKVSAANVANSYWATDSSGQTGSSAADSANSYSGALLTQLQCPVSADSTSCAANTLYTGWSSVTDAEGNAYWDFGDSYQLPGLLLNGTVFRDSDGDGQMDSINNP